MQHQELMLPAKLLKDILPQLEIRGLKNFHQHLDTCQLQVSSSDGLTNFQQVREKVKQFNPEQGWLCFQSEVIYFETEENQDNSQKEQALNKPSFFEKLGLSIRLWRKLPNTQFKMPESGILLYGEVVNNQKSLHIREDGHGGCILTYFTEKKGKDVLVETKSFLGEGKGLTPEKLYYRIYWQYDEQYGYRQFAARFIGFKQ